MNGFEKIIKDYLDRRASEDAMFAAKYNGRCEREEDAVAGCCDYIKTEARKQAMKKMMKNIEEVRVLYARYFEKDFVDMMTDYGSRTFDDHQYDNFTADTYDFVRLGLTFYEHAYRKPEDKEVAIAKIAEMPHDLDLFDQAFIDSFKYNQ